METPADQAIHTPPCPLYVDLDGTLVRCDTFLDTLPALLRRRPWLLPVVVWWVLAGGLARLKQELARRMVPDPAGWPFVPALLEWLTEQHRLGRRIVLATASDQRVARSVCDHLGLFDGVLASDGVTNRRAAAKMQAIRQDIGNGPFAYAGNSRDDLVLWNEAAEIVVVNAPAAVRRELQNRGMKPVLVILTLPITFLTLGLFLLVINAGLVLLAAKLIPGFTVESFWWALGFSLVLSVVQGLLNALDGGAKRKEE